MFFKTQFRIAKFLWWILFACFHEWCDLNGSINLYPETHSYYKSENVRVNDGRPLFLKKNIYKQCFVG